LWISGKIINPLNAELNPICHLLVLLGARPILYISRIRVKGKIKEYVLGGSNISQAQQDRQRMYKCNVDARSRYHCCHRKEISITYSECVFVALIIQHAKRMRRIILSSVACLDLQYFFQDFRKKSYWTPNVCFNICPNFFFLRRIQRIAVINLHSSSFLADFNKTLIFWRIFEIDINIKFYKNPSSRSRFVPCERMDGQTERRKYMTRLIAAFRNFVNASVNKGRKCLHKRM